MTAPGEGSRAVYPVKPEGVEEQVNMRVYEVDGDFVEIMGLQMSEGRNLNDEASDEIVINEAAVRMLGWTEPLGRRINFRGQDRRVVGVIKDFHFDGPRSKIEPLLMGPHSKIELPFMALINHWMGVIIVRVQPGHLDEALKVIDDQWAAIAPYRPIYRQSLEEVFARLYSKELLTGRALTVSLFLVIVVASVGLFGMAAHAAQERTKEIGIRKVFGASPGGLDRYAIARLCQARRHCLPPQRAHHLRVGHLLATRLCLSRRNRRGPVLGVGRFVLRHRRANGGVPSDASGTD